MGAALTPLRKRYRRAYDVVPLILAAATTLALGLSLPVMDVEKFVFWESEYSVITGVAGLFEDGEWLLGFIILLFSIVFPIAKLFVLAAIWVGKMTHEQRFGLLRLLDKIGRWSMLDVFAVGILVVVGKLGAVADVQARVGIYLFAFAILLAMLATWRVKQLALKASRLTPGELPIGPATERRTA